MNKKIQFWKRKLLFMKSQWKLGFHLIFRTKHFGVNNEWWSHYPSLLFGWAWYKILWAIVTIRPLLRNYESMKFRATVCCFMTKEQLKIMGWKREYETN